MTVYDAIKNPIQIGDAVLFRTKMSSNTYLGIVQSFTKNGNVRVLKEHVINMCLQNSNIPGKPMKNFYSEETVRNELVVNVAAILSSTYLDKLQELKQNHETLKGLL